MKWANVLDLGGVKVWPLLPRNCGPCTDVLAKGVGGRVRIHYRVKSGDSLECLTQSEHSPASVWCVNRAGRGDHTGKEWIKFEVLRGHARIVYCVRKKSIWQSSSISIYRNNRRMKPHRNLLVWCNTRQDCKGHTLKMLENLSSPYKPRSLSAETDYSSSRALCADGRRQAGEQSCTDHSSQHDICAGSQRPSVS